MNHIITYFIFLIVFASLDFFWIGFIRHGYRKFIDNLLHISSLGRLVIYWIPAIIAYFLLALAPSVFIFRYATNESTLLWFLSQGALMGLIIYGIYDMTNWAVLKQWKTSMTVIDITWGVFLYATSVTVVGLIAQHYMLIK